MEGHRFTGVLWRWEAQDAWRFVSVPADLTDAIRLTAGPPKGFASALTSTAAPARSRGGPRSPPSRPSGSSASDAPSSPLSPGRSSRPMTVSPTTRPAVLPSQPVSTGEQVGGCGNSGNSTEPHVHVQVIETPRFNETAHGIPLAFHHHGFPDARVPAESEIVTA